MIDCHLHLQDPVFQSRLTELMDQLRLIGVEKLVVNGTEEADWGRVEVLAESYSEVIPFFGVHPWNVPNVSENWEESLRKYLTRFPGAGLGEIGLDRWIRDHDIARQRAVFLTQLEMAEELSRPVTVHCLQAWGHLLECLDESPFSGHFLLHSYGGPREMIPSLLSRGAFFSLSGYFFRPDKQEKLKTFEGVPAERILLETDAPDMTPPPECRAFSWERCSGEKQDVNHPGNIKAIYSAYVSWSGSMLDSVEQQQRESFNSFYSGN